MARILGVDIPGEKRIDISLRYIYGIGPTRAAKILNQTRVNPDTRVRDLSAGGVFISTNAPLSKGSPIQLLFSLPEGEMRIEGIVRYSNAGRGMGVEFAQMGVADRARLQELIRRLNS